MYTLEVYVMFQESLDSPAETTASLMTRTTVVVYHV
jgi:hypothetical protein